MPDILDRLSAGETPETISSEEPTEASAEQPDPEGGFILASNAVEEDTPEEPAPQDPAPTPPAVDPSQVQGMVRDAMQREAANAQFNRQQAPPQPPPPAQVDEGRLHEDPAYLRQVIEQTARDAQNGILQHVAPAMARLQVLESQNVQTGHLAETQALERARKLSKSLGFPEADFDTVMPDIRQAAANNPALLRDPEQIHNMVVLLRMRKGMPLGPSAPGGTPPTSAPVSGAVEAGVANTGAALKEKFPFAERMARGLGLDGFNLTSEQAEDLLGGR